MPNSTISNYIEEQKILLERLDNEYQKLLVKKREVEKKIEFGKQTGATKKDLLASSTELDSINEKITNNRYQKDEAYADINRFKEFVRANLVNKVNNLDDDTINNNKAKEVQDKEKVVVYLNSELDFFTRLLKELEEQRDLQENNVFNQEIKTNIAKITSYENAYVKNSDSLNATIIDEIKRLRKENERLEASKNEKSKEDHEIDKDIYWVKEKIEYLQKALIREKKELKVLKSAGSEVYRANILGDIKGNVITRNSRRLSNEYLDLYLEIINKGIKDDELDKLIIEVHELLGKIVKPIIKYNLEGKEVTTNLIDFNKELEAQQGYLEALKYDYSFINERKFDPKYLHENIVKANLLDVDNFLVDNWLKYFGNDISPLLSDLHFYTTKEELVKEALASNIEQTIKKIVNNYLMEKELITLNISDLENEQSLNDALVTLQERLTNEEQKYREMLTIQDRESKKLNSLYQSINDIFSTIKNKLASDVKDVNARKEVVDTGFEGQVNNPEAITEVEVTKTEEESSRGIRAVASEEAPDKLISDAKGLIKNPEVPLYQEPVMPPVIDEPQILGDNNMLAEDKGLDQIKEAVEPSLEIETTRPDQDIEVVGENVEEAKLDSQVIASEPVTADNLQNQEVNGVGDINTEVGSSEVVSISNPSQEVVTEVNNQDVMPDPFAALWADFNGTGKDADTILARNLQ